MNTNQHKNIRLPHLGDIAEQALSKLSQRTLAISGIIVVLGAISLSLFVLKPSYQESERLRNETERALSLRNRELVKSAVEQASNNIGRILGAAESAVTSIQSSFTLSNIRPPATITPLEKEFYEGGKLTGGLSKNEGYDGPVTFDFPQIKLGNPSELAEIKNYWPAFLKTTKALYLHHPELKWLYMGTAGGSFVVFPASPMIPKEFDPRTRSWFKEAHRQKKMVWVSPYFTAGGNDLVLTVAQPLQANKFNDAVIGVDVVMSDIINNILTTPYCDKCTFYLVNEKGELVGKRGDKTQGASWEQYPKARTLAEDFAEFLPVASASQIASQALDNSKFASVSSTGLIRTNRATQVDSGKSSYTVFSAPIESLKWSLIGVVPTNYAGADGAKVISGVAALLNSNQSMLIALVFVGAIFVGLLIFGIFAVARSSVKRTLTPSIDQFARLTANLDQLKLNGQKVTGDPIGSGEDSITAEHAQVVDAVQRLQDRLQEEIKQHESLAVQARLGELAATVAHDIRSPLSSMRAASEDLSTRFGSDVSADKSNPAIVLRLGIDRVNSILGRLLREYREVENDSVGPAESAVPKLTLLDKAIHDVVAEHTASLPENIHLKADGFSSVPVIWGAIQIGEIQSAISNIITNAVEAMSKTPNGELSVKFSTGNKIARLEISDNGVGMPPEVLPQIFDKDFTFGKTGGTGLGLYQAKKAIEWQEGKISVSSFPGKGSTFVIELPVSAAPSWLAGKIEFSLSDTLHFIDDDPSMLAYWKEQVERVPGLNAKFSTSAKDFEDADLTNQVLVVDHHFRKDKKTGLDIIEGLSAPVRTYLCTTAYDDPKVQAAADKLGIQVIPKPMIYGIEFSQRGPGQV